MSLVSTLAKLAIGYAVTRGLKSVVGGGGARKSGGGSIFGRKSGGGSTGLEDIMEGLTKGSGRPGTGGGGLGDILGQLGGAAQSGGGTLGGLGGLLTNALGNGGRSVDQQTSQQDEDAAGLLIRAMLQAAKADGRVDEDEKTRLMANLGDLSNDELEFINAEMERPVDIPNLARNVPNGMESQVYMMSLMGIDLDNQNEAAYLNDLAGEMRLSQSQVNQIHQLLGVDPLYS